MSFYSFLFFVYRKIFLNVFQKIFIRLSFVKFLTYKTNTKRMKKHEKGKWERKRKEEKALCLLEKGMWITMSISKSYFFETSGYDFESQMADFITLFARDKWGNSAVKFSTEYQDRYEGTDIFLLGIPVDITLDFANKNKTKRLDTLVLDGVTIDLGARFGNGKADFETPVLVVGADTALGITKHNMCATRSQLKRLGVEKTKFHLLRNISTTDTLKSGMIG